MGDSVEVVAGGAVGVAGAEGVGVLVAVEALVIVSVLFG